MHHQSFGQKFQIFVGAYKLVTELRSRGHHVGAVGVMICASSLLFIPCLGPFVLIPFGIGGVLYYCDR